MLNIYTVKEDGSAKMTGAGIDDSIMTRKYTMKQRYLQYLPAFSLILISLMILIACPKVDSGIPSPIVNVVSITVTQTPTKTAYYVNETFDPSGLVVTAAYSDGSSRSVTSYSLSSPSMNTAGTKTVTVTFEGKTASFTITVTAVPVVSLASITVTQTPTKTAYYVNEAFDPSGLVVTAAYSDGSLRSIPGYSLSSPGMDTAGTKTVTVTFEGKTASFIITVNPIPGEGDLGIIIY
jgi:hypothetical protein